MRLPALIIACLCLIGSTIARAGFLDIPDEQKGVGVDEKLNGQLALDTTFIDETGKTVSLRDCIRPGKPAVLQLGYFGCPMLCDTVSQGLLHSMNDLDLKIGKDFDVIFISIDPKETHTDAFLKKKGYAKSYEGGDGAGAGWHFLTGNADSIKYIADAVGFRYKWIEQASQFSHPAVLMVLTPEGRLSRYLYGVEYQPQTLRLSLVEASQGTIGTISDRVLMICLAYDSHSGKYALAAMKLMRLGGIVTIVALGLAITLMLLRERRVSVAAAKAQNSKASDVI